MEHNKLKGKCRFKSAKCQMKETEQFLKNWKLKVEHFYWVWLNFLCNSHKKSLLIFCACII